jgi:hypothetical protein
VGHYYWDRLIRDSNQLGPFRELFGDEQADYAKALEQHYQKGPAADWQTRCVSAYASVHPWEDWAESWAHYLHMVDSMKAAESSLKRFDRMINGWYSLTYVLNNLNRSLGLPDVYPFVHEPWLWFLDRPSSESTVEVSRR